MAARERLFMFAHILKCTELRTHTHLQLEREREAHFFFVFGEFSLLCVCVTGDDCSKPRERERERVLRPENEGPFIYTFYIVHIVYVYSLIGL